MRGNAKVVKVVAEVLLVLINAVLAGIFSMAWEIFSYSHLLRTTLAIFAERTLICGLVAVAAVCLLRWSLKSFVLRFSLLLTVTALNHICLSAFLVSLLPFGGRVLPAQPKASSTEDRGR